MKKLLVVLAACVLVAGVAAQANAAFTSGDLVRVVIDVTGTSGAAVYGYEQATDLGSAASIEANPSTLTNNSFSLTTGNSGNNFAGTSGTLYVAYFAVNGGLHSTATEFWTSGGNGALETNTGYLSFTGISSAANSVLTTGYNGNGGASSSSIWYSTSATTSYFKGMDHSSVTTRGGFDGFTASGAGDGEAALVSGGNVLQGLFDWTSPTKETSQLAQAITLVTNYTGGIISTTAEVATTPIPPSVLLLGSGLLGLIGIKRRNVFNW